jgi:phosphate transport system ATP-binding protein
MQRAVRVSHNTALFFNGHIIEFGTTTQIFSNPARKQAEEYITGRFG